MPKRFLALLLLATAAVAVRAWAADPDPAALPPAAPGPVSPAPSVPSAPLVLPVAVRVVSPAADAVVTDNNVDIFVQADNYAVAEGGNAIRLILDNGAPQTLADLRAPLTLHNLAEGGHVLRVLAVRPDGTALTNPEAYALVRFFVRRRDFQNAVDPARPYLTVNLPLTGKGPGAALQGRVWFDFRAHNAPLTKQGGYVVRCTVNQASEVIDEEKPIYWDKLQPGRYDLTAELLTSDLKPVPGPFNRVTRTFDVQAPVKAMPAGPAAPAAPPRAVRKEAID